MPSEPIWGERVGIRRLRPLDARALLRMVARPEVARLLFEEMGQLPSSFELGLLIWSHRLANRPDFGIVDRAGRLIGCVRFWRISRINRNAMLTIFIGEPSLWGKGLGSEALRLALRYAFEEMELERVELQVFAFNERAIRSYEKIGFRREGVRRGALYRDGAYHDIILMGIRRFEFALAEASTVGGADRVGKETALGGENTQERSGPEGGDSGDRDE
jgi:RimJ/RimL family protein N-acetyltransferase